MIDRLSIDKTRPISIHFHPYKFDNFAHAVEKVEKGCKRKYLYGISSGIKVDGHGERMTENCIKSMMEQGNSGDIQLFAGRHGIDFINDLGILAESSIEKGDWITGYRLYDEFDIDTIGQISVAKANKLWAQVNGLPPYKAPKQRGFSIEGVVPENEILDKKVLANGSWIHRVINDMILDGTIVVDRPAYQDSVITAVYKCLQEYKPEKVNNIKIKYASFLSQTLKEKEEERNFYQKFFELNSVLEEAISDIMKFDTSNGKLQQRLEILFDEYKTLMVGLILQNADIFKTSIEETEVNQPQVMIATKQKELLKKLAESSRQLSNLLISRIGGKK